MDGMVLAAAELHVYEGTGALKGPEHASGGQERASKTKLFETLGHFLLFRRLFSHLVSAIQSLSECFSVSGHAS